MNVADSAAAVTDARDKTALGDTTTELSGEHRLTAVKCGIMPSQETFTNRRTAPPAADTVRRKEAALAKGRKVDVTTSVQTVSGNAPLVFTTSLGQQRSVPLSALEFSGSSIQLATGWSTEFGAADSAILLALAQARAATGDLVPTPAAPPVAAVTFTAAEAGPAGNNITVTVGTPSTTSALTAQVVITATETDTYHGLASASAAAAAIGVDTASTAAGAPPQGTGLVVVQAASVVTGAGLPQDNQTFSVTGATDVLAANGTSTLFVLEPRPGFSGTPIPVTVKLDSGGKTFTVQATFAAGNTTAVALTGLASLPAAVTRLVTAAAPPGGLALPAAGTVTLTGGSASVAATGTAFTSSS